MGTAAFFIDVEPFHGQYEPVTAGYYETVNQIVTDRCPACMTPVSTNSVTVNVADKETAALVVDTDLGTSGVQATTLSVTEPANSLVPSH